MKKTNLGIYNQMKSFSENMKYEQKLELKLTENMMVMENIKSKLEEIENQINEQKENSMLKNYEELKESMKELASVTQYDELKEEMKEFVSIDHLEHCNDKIKTIKEDTDEKIDNINKKLEEEYINADDLNKYSENIQNTLQDYVYKQTPRVNTGDTEKLTFELKELQKQNKMLYEKFDKMKTEMDNSIKEIEAKANDKNYLDSLRTSYDIEEQAKNAVKPLVTKKTVPNLKFNKK